MVVKRKSLQIYRYNSGLINGIKVVKEAKYLGIFISNNLNFNKQISIWKQKINKIRKKLSMMKYHEKNN